MPKTMKKTTYDCMDCHESIKRKENEIGPRKCPYCGSGEIYRREYEPEEEVKKGKGVGMKASGYPATFIDQQGVKEL